MTPEEKAAERFGPWPALLGHARQAERHARMAEEEVWKHFEDWPMMTGLTAGATGKAEGLRRYLEEACPPEILEALQTTKQRKGKGCET